MCGIAGYINLDNEKRAEKEIVKRMTDVIAHRGPDGEGYFIEGNVAFGHRRLSIIDLDTGEQPMISIDGNIVIILNGELYNYIELRNELIGKGYQFRTRSDTEVVINAYSEWGRNCLNKFNGMWGFALYDKRNKEIFISKDRIGEKPLHYYYDDDVFIFGSEIKSILEYGVNTGFNEKVMELYLVFGYVPAPYTFYKNIFKLKPGHNILIQNNKVKFDKYWDIPEIDEQNMVMNKEKIYEEFEYLLRDSVKIRMRSDVPYGAFLSGGLDSSSVVALMSDMSSYPVETFTIGFDDKNFDESDLAYEVAGIFNCNHHTKFVSHDSFDESLEKVLEHYDEPFGDSSAIPTGYVSKYARENVKMVLTGDGGDEVLSGYTSYQGEKFASDLQIIPISFRKFSKLVAGKSKLLLKGNKRYKVNRIENILYSSLLDYNTRLIQKSSWYDYSAVKDLILNKNDIFHVEDFIGDFFNGYNLNDGFYKNMFFNLKISLPDDMLTKVDRMSMAFSLEARVPFLDFRLIEFLSRVDKKVKMERYERKSILRNTIGRNLPVNLLRARKRGFGVPLREWFKSEVFKNKFPELKNLDGILKTNQINNIIDLNNRGKLDSGNFIWMLFVLSKWISKN